MDFNTRKSGSERRNPQIVYAYGSSPHQYNLVFEDIAGNVFMQNVRNRNVGKGLFPAPVVNQDAP